MEITGLGAATDRQVPGVAAGDVYLQLASDQPQKTIRHEFGCEMILRDGSTPGFMMSRKSGQDRPWELTFGWSELPWEQVRVFRVRVRPIHTVLYRNVSLQPGHETEVDVVYTAVGTGNNAGGPPLLRHLAQEQAQEAAVGESGAAPSGIPAALPAEPPAQQTPST